MEFIVWDKTKNKFSELKGIQFFKDGFVVNPRDLIRLRMDEQIGDTQCSLHQYIGKKDINGKKIYDDCSIVEFDYVNEKFLLIFSFAKRH